MSESLPPEGKALEPTESELSLARFAARQGALYEAWFNAALEQTKAVFAISSAGVGLSLTLIFGRAAKGQHDWGAIWLVFALVSFAASAWFCTKVFTANTRIVARLVKDLSSKEHEAYAGRFHSASVVGFIMGVVFFVFAAVAHIWLN